MSRTLVLVDMDHLPATRAHQMPGGYWGAPSAHVVVVGLNSATASGARRTFASLRAVGAAQARLLGLEGPVNVELALTLTMPQAVDMALIRLLEEAPCTAHAGRFERCVLLTRDRGLRKLWRQRLAISDCRPVLEGMGASAQGFFERRAPSEVVSASPGIADPWPTGDRCVETREQAAWAGSRRIRPHLAGRELKEVAAAMEAHPVLVGQVGLTRGSCRGLERLEFLPDDPPVLCAADDGAVVRAGPVDAYAVGQPGDAGLGPGVAIVTDDLTGQPQAVRTQLPYVMVAVGAARDAVAVVEGRLADDEILAALSNHGGHVGRMHIRFERLRAFVVEPEVAWWFVGRRATSERSVPLLPGRAFQVAADLVAMPMGDDFGAAFRPVVGRCMALPSTRVGPRKIASATATGTGEAVALLATRWLEARKPVRALPIQDISRSDVPLHLSDQLWSLLRTLPLHVACQSTVEPSVEGSRGERQ